MLVLRTLLLSLIAVVLAVSGTARAMPMPMAAQQPPCHEAPATPDKHKPAPIAVNCCAACMPAPTDAAVALAATTAHPTAYAVVETAIEGRLTAPEPDPPRSRA